ncbi:MAG: S8 family serine peptidase [Planctomycetota bacterium]
MSLLPALAAQGEASARPTSERASATAGELVFQVGDLTVRRTADAAACRRAGASAWTPLAAPDDQLRLVMGQFDPLRGLPSYDGALVAPAGTRLHVVQFHTQVLPEYRAALVAAGAQALHVLPANCLVVRGDARAMAAVRALPCVRWLGALPNAWKVDADARAFLLAGADVGARERNLVLAAKPDRERLAGSVVAMGGTVTELCEGSTMLRAALTPAQLGMLFADDTVVFVDPVTATGEDMDNARIQGGAVYVETLGGYNGQGVIAEITESFQETHPDFAGRFLVRGTNSAGNHGHCTAGIVAGSGANNAAARGVMSQCTVVEHGYTSAGAHYANILGSVDPTSPTRSMQATASWGSVQTTQYTSVSQAVDDGLFDADFVRTQSMSNLGNQSVRPEAWAKNSISVGGVRHQDNSNPADDVWQGASIGPASDGRLKPEVTAYYESVLTSDRTGTSGYNTAAGVTGDYYASFSGTSSATPIVNGFVGIMQQMFTDGLFRNVLPQPATAANRFANKPKMSTVKAMLCNTASQYPFASAADNLSRVKQGWGFPSLQRLYDNRSRIVVLDEYDTLQIGQSRSYWIYVAPGTPELRVTMVHADQAALPSAAVHLINDANLKVTRWSDGTSWWGNNGLAAGNFSTAGGVANNRDTVECVYLQNPTPGIYLVDVAALSIPQDGKVETPQIDMDFALAMHPMGGGYHATGGLTMDLQSSGPGNLTFAATGVPATGWTDGFTLLSFTTTRGEGFGRFFGLEDDGLTALGFASPAAPGNVFHFTNTPGVYPAAPVVFPDPSLISFLAGIKLDAVMMLWNGGNLVAVSNVDRITLQ